MESIDWKLIIALVALILSLYNLLSSKRISALEKRTEVMSEIGEAQYLIVQIHEVSSDLCALDLQKIPKLEKEFIKIKEAVNVSEQQLQYIFAELSDNYEINVNKLEKIRPLIHKVTRDEKIILKQLKFIGDEMQSITKELATNNQSMYIEKS